MLRQIEWCYSDLLTCLVYTPTKHAKHRLKKQWDIFTQNLYSLRDHVTRMNEIHSRILRIREMVLSQWCTESVHVMWSQTQCQCQLVYTLEIHSACAQVQVKMSTQKHRCPLLLFLLERLTRNDSILYIHV